MKNLKLLLQLCLIFTLLAPRASIASWAYSKASVIEFLSDWRAQVSGDAYLEERERDLRLELIDRLNFQVDRKFNDQDLRAFFQNVTLEMALTDEMAQNRVWGGSSEFLKNLHMSLQEVLEPSENILGFVRAYVEFTSLNKPKPIEEFVVSRSYTNGAEIESAESLSLEQAGAAVDAPNPAANPAPVSNQALPSVNEGLETPESIKCLSF